MARLAIRLALSAALAAMAMMMAAPVSAQLYSDGYKFLQAIKKKEGDEATELLRRPGTTVVNSRDVGSGETGLHLTVQRRDLVWTEWLIQEGANPNIADKNGVTPLILATQMNFIGGVEALIDGGARMDVGNNTGETPLMTAVLSRNFELMEVLLKAGANPDRSDNSGRSARDYARERDNSGQTLRALERHEKPADEREGASYGPSF